MQSNALNGETEIAVFEGYAISTNVAIILLMIGWKLVDDTQWLGSLVKVPTRVFHFHRQTIYNNCHKFDLKGASSALQLRQCN